MNKKEVERLKQCARDIKQYCNTNTNCRHCLFKADNDGCVLQNQGNTAPEVWKLEVPSE